MTLYDLELELPDYGFDPHPRCFGSEKGLDNDIDCYGCRWFDECTDLAIKKQDVGLLPIKCAGFRRQE